MSLHPNRRSRRSLNNQELASPRGGVYAVLIEQDLFSEVTAIVAGHQGMTTRGQDRRIRIDPSIDPELNALGIISYAAKFSVFENSWNFSVINVCILLLKRVPRSRKQLSMLSLKAANLS